MAVLRRRWCPRPFWVLWTHGTSRPVRRFFRRYFGPHLAQALRGRLREDGPSAGAARVRGLDQGRVVPGDHPDGPAVLHQAASRRRAQPATRTGAAHRGSGTTGRRGCATAIRSRSGTTSRRTHAATIRSRAAIRAGTATGRGRAAAGRGKAAASRDQATARRTGTAAGRDQATARRTGTAAGRDQATDGSDWSAGARDRTAGGWDRACAA
jgi:hypothetical protein